MEVLKISPVSGRSEIPVLLNLMNLDGEGVEIGVRDAEYAEIVAGKWGCSTLHLVDPWTEVEDSIDPHAFDPKSEENARNRMAKFGDKIKWHKCLSMEAVAKFADESLDFVYIDANHSYKYVSEDMDKWWHTIKFGGVLAGHDIYSMFCPQVTQAVVEFCQSKQVVAYIVRGDFDPQGRPMRAPSWYIIKERK